MKKLSELNKLPSVHYNLDNLRYKYTGKKYLYEVNLCDDYLNSSFDDFIERNNITIIDERTYVYYLMENFNESKKRYYELYQSHIYETIERSLPARKLMDKIRELSPNIHITNDRYVNRQKVTQFSFHVDKKEDLKDIFTKQVKALLKQYNYYVKNTIDADKNGPTPYCIILEPYKPEDITDKIYDELNGILYHLTTKDAYLKCIKNRELVPQWHISKKDRNDDNDKEKNNDKNNNAENNEYRDGRIFFIGNENENEVRRQLRQIKNTSWIFRNNNPDKKEPIILKVDLKKYNNKLRFRRDSSSRGYDAYFTEEPIPDFCITPIDLETWKELKI